MDDKTLGVSAHIIDALLAKGLRLATAESCTGGLLAKVLTDTPGSSSYYLGGVVCYANALKSRLLGVSEERLSRHGAVSREVACDMVKGCRERLGADIALATTGVAGPGGGSVDKPVGTVWIACLLGEKLNVRKLELKGTRSEIREQSVSEILGELEIMLSGKDVL